MKCDKLLKAALDSISGEHLDEYLNSNPNIQEILNNYFNVDHSIGHSENLPKELKDMFKLRGNYDKNTFRGQLIPTEQYNNIFEGRMNSYVKINDMVSSTDDLDTALYYKDKDNYLRNHEPILIEFDNSDIPQYSVGGSSHFEEGEEVLIKPGIFEILEFGDNNDYIKLRQVNSAPKYETIIDLSKDTEN